MAAVEAIAQSVSHAKFVCSDMASYEVVLSKIVLVCSNQAYSNNFDADGSQSGAAAAALEPGWCLADK